VHPVFRSPFCFISSLFIAMLVPPMILNNQLIYSINTPLAIYLLCSLRVPWLANNKAFVCCLCKLRSMNKVIEIC
jgi:hypothetical protein